jgi:hypothetical protein
MPVIPEFQGLKVPWQVQGEHSKALSPKILNSKDDNKKI